jgi:hypothetical protein
MKFADPAWPMVNVLGLTLAIPAMVWVEALEGGWAPPKTRRMSCTEAVIPPAVLTTTKNWYVAPVVFKGLVRVRLNICEPPGATVTLAGRVTPHEAGMPATDGTNVCEEAVGFFTVTA